MIRVFDGYGRELFITRQQWRENVLPGTIEKAWNQPEDLYAIIVQALNDGFIEDMVRPAKQLHGIDPVPSRGATVLGIVYLQTKRLDDAERVLTEHGQKHGEDGVVLTNLAKVYSAKGDEARSLKTLWHALELDPNQDNGLVWYEAIHREKEGEAAGLEALRRVAAQRGSWRAQLWLARAALRSRDLPGALALYEQSLANAGQPTPADLLMQLSGDLGNQAHLPEIIQLVAPRFDPAHHGLQVGNNLIKAYLDLGQVAHARRILEQLYAQKRLDWREALSFWDTEIAKVVTSVSQPDPSAPLSITLLSIKGPVWLRESSPVLELFPAKSGDGSVVCFLGSSAELNNANSRVQMQMSDVPGRLSRAVPLFLTEQAHFRTTAIAQTLIPWITEPHGGFVLSGVPWTDEDASHHARLGEPKGDYVVITHLRTKTEPWTFELRLVRTIDGARLGEVSAPFQPTQPETAMKQLSDGLVRLLQQHADAAGQETPANYVVPGGPDFPYYLLRLEQALAVLGNTLEGKARGALSGERDIVDGNIHLCVSHPNNPTARILLAETLRQMKKAKPDLLPEFREKVSLLQREKPLPEPARSILQRELDALFKEPTS